MSTFKVSVICTVLNEGQGLRGLLDSLAAQTYPPDEVIFVDGGSTDNTVALLESYAAAGKLPLKIFTAPGANISRGRNIAITAASGPIIASTDAGVRLDRRWLELLLQPFRRAEPPEVVAGFFIPDPHSSFEVAMGATVLPAVTDVNPATFLPSSRSVAFLKSSWARVLGYPEWLDYCEDLIFDFRLRDTAGPFAFAPQAVVYFRPRSTLRAFFKQYYQYARGDGKADLWRKRHGMRYATYLVALPLLVFLGAIRSRRWWWLGALLAGGGMFFKPYRRLLSLWQPLPVPQKIQALLWVPIIRITGDVAKMMGYPAGWKWRRTHLPARPELRWREFPPRGRDGRP